jgi:hypothetical protein
VRSDVCARACTSRHRIGQPFAGGLWRGDERAEWELLHRISLAPESLAGRVRLRQLASTPKCTRVVNRCLRDLPELGEPCDDIRAGYRKLRVNRHLTSIAVPTSASSRSGSFSKPWMSEGTSEGMSPGVAPQHATHFHALTCAGLHEGLDGLRGKVHVGARKESLPLRGWASLRGKGGGTGGSSWKIQD